MLLEREAELDVAQGALREAASGQGQVLVVDGPAGIGKTSLLQAIGAAAAAAGFEVLWARGDDLESAFAYEVLRQLLAPALVRLDPPARADVLEGPASAIAALVEGTADHTSKSLGADGLTIAYGLSRLIQDLADRRPLLVCVDDAQWADLPSLRALAFVARRLGGLPVLMAFSARTPVEGAVGDLLGRVASVPGGRRLALEPLGEEAVATLAARPCPPGPIPSSATACGTPPGGTPSSFTRC